MAAPTTETLLERCREGDELAWEALVRRYQGRVFAVSVQYLRDREEARDTAQDVFVQIYRKLGAVRDDRAFLAWVLRLTRNRCLDRLRRLGARRSDREVPVEEAAEIADPAPGPEDRGLGGDRRRLLDRALGRLSTQSREMIVLKEMQEMRVGEIADLLDLPVGTVKSRCHRARLELAETVRKLDPSRPAEAGGAS